MHIISRKKLLEFSEVHPDAGTSLDNWHRAAKLAKWKHLEDVRQVYPNAEAVGNLTVFNVKGSKYRLIVSIIYPAQRIYIKYILLMLNMIRKVER